MRHEGKVREFLADKKPGDALLYLAKQLDILSGSNLWNPVDEDWTVEDERPSDPEDALAWDARKRLESDAKREPTPDIFAPPASMIERSITEHSIDIMFPDPSWSQRQARKGMVERLKLDQENWFQPHIPPCAEQYVEGGPVWLYLAYRQYMETLPRDVIHAMILDVFEWSPADAGIISADLLRRPDDDDAAGSRYEIALSQQND